jgi:hypothetical protein
VAGREGERGRRRRGDVIILLRAHKPYNFSYLKTLRESKESMHTQNLSLNKNGESLIQEKFGPESVSY